MRLSRFVGEQIPGAIARRFRSFTRQLPGTAAIGLENRHEIAAQDHEGRDASAVLKFEADQFGTDVYQRILSQLLRDIDDLRDVKGVILSKGFTLALTFALSLSSLVESIPPVAWPARRKKPVTTNPWTIPRSLSGRRVGLHFCPERDHTGNQPLSPHLIDFTLEVIDIIFGKVRESSLL